MDCPIVDEALFDWVGIEAGTSKEWEAAAIACDEILKNAIVKVESTAMNFGSVLCGKELGQGSIELELASCLVTLESSSIDSEAFDIDASFREAQCCVERLDYNLAYQHLLVAQRNTRYLKQQDHTSNASLALPGTSSSAAGVKTEEFVSSNRVVKVLKGDLARIYLQYLSSNTCNSSGKTESSLSSDDVMVNAGRIVEMMCLLLPIETATQIHASILINVMETYQNKEAVQSDLDLHGQTGSHAIFRTGLVNILSISVAIMTGKYGCTPDILARELVCPLIRNSINFSKKDGNSAEEALLLSHQALLTTVISAQEAGRGCQLSLSSLYREVWKDDGAWLCSCSQDAVRQAFRPCRLTLAERTRVALARPWHPLPRRPSPDKNRAAACAHSAASAASGEERERRVVVYSACARGMRQVDSLCRPCVAYQSRISPSCKVSAAGGQSLPHHRARAGRRIPAVAGGGRAAGGGGVAGGAGGGCASRVRAEEGAGGRGGGADWDGGVPGMQDGGFVPAGFLLPRGQGGRGAGGQGGKGSIAEGGKGKGLGKHAARVVARAAKLVRGNSQRHTRWRIPARLCREFVADATARWQ